MRLALLGDDHLFALGHLTECSGYWTAVPPSADHHRRPEDAGLGDDRDALGGLAHILHPDSPAYVRPGGGRSLEQVVIELATDDAVAGGTAPGRRVASAGVRKHAGLERLNGERILFWVDLEILERGRGNPAGAD